MAMTLRLEADDDQALEELAALYGLSKQQAAARAIRETRARVTGIREVDALADQALIRWAEVFETLKHT